MIYTLAIKPRTSTPKPKSDKLFYDYSRELKELSKLVKKI